MYTVKNDRLSSFMFLFVAGESAFTTIAPTVIGDLFRDNNTQICPQLENFKTPTFCLF
jgi:hypothetical protein